MQSHPDHLVAAIAARFLESGSKETDDIRFAEAAQRACHFLDICAEEASTYLIRKPRQLGKRVTFKKALLRITGIRRHSNALKRYRDFLLYLELDIDGISDPITIPDRLRAAQAEVERRIAREQTEGIFEGRAEALKELFANWHDREISELRKSVAAKSRGVGNAK